MMTSVSKACPICSWKGLLERKKNKTLTLGTVLLSGRVTSSVSFSRLLPGQPTPSPLLEPWQMSQLSCVHCTEHHPCLQGLLPKLGLLPAYHPDNILWTCESLKSTPFLPPGPNQVPATLSFLFLSHCPHPVNQWHSGDLRRSPMCPPKQD